MKKFFGKEEKMELKEAEDLLRKKIEGDYKQLKEDFQAGQFKNMAKLLGNNTVLFTPEGKRLKGKRSLTKFWRLKKKATSQFKDVNIEFKPVYICSREVKNIVKNEDPQKTIVHFACVISEYTITGHKSDGKTEIALFMTAYPHPEPCVWES
jgi:hypothetical protein